MSIYESVTERIVSALAASHSRGSATGYKLPWAAAKLPFNWTTGKPYSGINTILLWLAQQDAGYARGAWATFNQINAAGGRVKRGEKSTEVIFWKPVLRTVQTDAEGAETDEPVKQESRGLICKSYRVFNIEQTEGVELAPEARVNFEERQANAEAFFRNCGASLREGGSRAFYSPSGDYIQVPRFVDFRRAASYYHVLAHEYAHWTGAAQRLNRDLKGRFGTDAYAMEELIAEMSAAFTSAYLKNETVVNEHCVPYLESWVRCLRQDHRAIFSVVSAARSATEYLVAKQPQAAVAGG